MAYESQLINSNYKKHILQNGKIVLCTRQVEQMILVLPGNTKITLATVGANGKTTLVRYDASDIKRLIIASLSRVILETSTNMSNNWNRSINLKREDERNRLKQEQQEPG